MSPSRHPVSVAALCQGSRSARYRTAGLSALVLAAACSVYDVPEVKPTTNGGGGGGGGSAGSSPAEPIAGKATSGGNGGALSAGGTEASGGDAAGSAALAGATGAEGGASGEGGAGGEAEHGGSAGSGGSPAAGSSGSSTGGGGQAGGGGSSSQPTDACPNDPNKLQPGKCGCGVPDVATPTVADCSTLKTKLRNRYDFEGTGTKVTDRVGDLDGVVRDAQLSQIDGKGVVLLGGGTSGGYVDLPNDILDGLRNASFEAWLSWGAGNPQQRIFDFGDTTNAAENVAGSGKTYFLATAKGPTGVAQIGFSLNGVPGEQRVSGTAALPTSLAQVVVVADDDADTLSLYVNGKKTGEGAWLASLGAINVVNAWLGRSQWDGDPELSGVFHEFRVYNGLLSAAEVAASYAGGTDPIYFSY